MQVRTADCRYGTFSYYALDTYVGRSLELYGEYSELEVGALARTLTDGEIVVEVGANIGAITVPMAEMVGSSGKIYAFEAQPQTMQLLRQNLAHNRIENVEVRHCAAGAKSGHIRVPRLEALGHANYGATEIGQGELTVPVEIVDDLNLDRLNLLKIDAEGSELDVLRGAEETIKHCRPIIYVENDRAEKSADLIGFLIDHDYRLFWHRPPLFSPSNFRGETRNVFGAVVSINMLCVPIERKIEVRGLDEVADLRVSDDMYDREIKRYQKIIGHYPNDLTARLLIAHYSNLMQRSEFAREMCTQNLISDPHHLGSRAVRGFLDLQAGNWKDGWPAYELRYQQKDTAQFGYRPHDVPHWDGEPTEEPVLIWAEQGFGDSIMFGRFMRHVLARAPNAFLEVQPQLFELFELSGLSPRLHRMGRTLPPHTYHCSLPSIPATLKLFDESDYRMGAPYLRADDKMVETWRKRAVTKLGICWRGSPRSERPFTRDIPSDALDPIFREFDPFLSLTQDGQFESFADTAAAMMSLDLVITVDTSVAHLAGALGVPVWLLLSFDPDWRWGLKGSTSIWYPTMRIFRQPRLRDWDSVVRDVLAALRERYGKREAA